MLILHPKNLGDKKVFFYWTKINFRTKQDQKIIGDDQMYRLLLSVNNNNISFHIQTLQSTNLYTLLSNYKLVQ